MSDSGFEQFVTDVLPRLHRVALATCRDARRAEDLVQATAESLLRSWPRVRAADDRYAYARRVLVNRLFDEQRRWWRRDRLVAVEEIDLFAASGVGAADGMPGGPVDDWGPLEARLTILPALHALPARQRAAVVLRHLEGMSVEEVAAAMGCSTGNVKRLTHDGLAAMRSALAELEGEAL